MADIAATWKKVGARCQVCGRYRIGLVGLGGETQFTLYHDWDFLGLHDTARQARAEAKRHSEVTA